MMGVLGQFCVVEPVDAIPRGEGRSGGDRDFEALCAKVWSKQLKLVHHLSYYLYL